MTPRALIALTLLLASPAVAQTEMHAQDAARLAEFDQHLGAALRVALSTGKRGDIDLLQEALAGTAIPALRTTLAGDWKCRTLGLGGASGVTSYAQFDCHFAPDGAGFVFEKRTGTARMSGRVSLRDGAMIYLGTGYEAGTDPTPYADLPSTASDASAAHRQIGVVEQSGPDSARILFPAPLAAGTFDLLFLTR